MTPIKTIDLWNDHKPSQSVDPFVEDYLNEETHSLAYDKVILCPNLVGNYQMINSITGKLDASISPRFNGGIIFLKNGKPKRLYLCQTNAIVSHEIGHDYGVQDIVAALQSPAKIKKTGKTLSELLQQNGVEVVVDHSVKSKFTSSKLYVPKNDPVLESADSMGILTLPTFLDDTAHWEAVSFNPDLVLNLGVIAEDFEINIEHKGFVLGIKTNAAGLRDSQNGRKIYGIALQTGNAQEYKKMVKHCESFCKEVGNTPTKETLSLNLDVSLLDREK